MLCRLRPKKQTGSAQPLAFSRPRIVGALLPFRARLRRRALRRSGCGGHPPRQRPTPRPFPCPGSATTERRRRATMDCWDVSRRSRDLIPAGPQMAIQHVHGKAVVQVEAAGPGRRGLQEQGSSERDGPGMGMGIEEGRARDRFRQPNRMRFVSSNIPRRSRPTSSGLPIDPYPRPSGSLYAPHSGTTPCRRRWQRPKVRPARRGYRRSTGRRKRRASSLPRKRFGSTAAGRDRSASGTGAAPVRLASATSDRRTFLLALTGAISSAAATPRPGRSPAESEGTC